MAEPALTDGHDETISPFLGKRLVGFHQEPDATVGAAWCDDEPLYLVFDDGAKLVVSVGGFHASGKLYVEAER